MFKYEKITNEIKQNIIDGIYTNNRLPSKRELSNNYNVSMITINKVLDLLKADGIISIKHGSGIYINDISNYLLHSDFESRMHGFKTTAKNLEYDNLVKKFHVIKATKFLAENLKVEYGAEVYEIIRCRVVNQKISQYEKTYMPVSIFPNMTKEHVLNSIYEYIIYDCNLNIDHTHDIVSCKNSTKLDRHYLEIKKDTALGTLEQIGWLSDGRIFQYTYCVFLPEHFRFKHVSPY